jgi:hypothetical protein
VIGTVRIAVVVDFVESIEVNVCFICDVANATVADAAGII